MTLEVGTVIGQRYKIQSLLGTDGAGTVYKAFDMLNNVDYAIKEVDFSYFPEKIGDTVTGGGTLTRDKAVIFFEREVNILTKLDHPNLPKVIEYFSFNKNIYYLVMSFINGKDLATMMEARRKQPFAESQLLEWIGQIMNALSYCHKNNVIHRDIKPVNIIVADNNKAFLVDFGISKNVNKVSSSATVGTRILTPKYSPPEQYIDFSSTDARSDIYSLGATMYTLLTGKQPIEAILRVMGNYMPGPKELIPTLSPVLDAVIQKAMSLKQEDRFQTIEEMRQAIFSAPFLLNNLQPSRIASTEPDTLKIKKNQAENKTSATLEIINRPLINTKIVFHINDVATKIGRSAVNFESPTIDLAALDQGRIISRFHAIIECRNGHYLLRDNNSHNGTWVNGKQLAANEDYLLKDGDDIRFGSQQPHGIQAIFRQRDL
jgi:eukaryotic-like serine/threonine-protein kinase